MEIERKYLVDLSGIDIEAYPSKELEQGYLSTIPVVRVRREGEEYYLTYKSGNGLVRVEENLPLTKESYEHLLEKADGYVITKRRYRIRVEAVVDEEGRPAWILYTRRPARIDRMTSRRRISRAMISEPGVRLRRRSICPMERPWNWTFFPVSLKV